MIKENSRTSTNTNLDRARRSNSEVCDRTNRKRNEQLRIAQRSARLDKVYHVFGEQIYEATFFIFQHLQCKDKPLASSDPFS